MTWVVVGAGAQGRITLEVLAAAFPGEERLVVDDDPVRIGNIVAGVPVHARAALPGGVLRGDGTRVVVCIGDNRARLRVAAALAAEGVTFGAIVHPSATVMPSATVDPGAVVMPGAMVQSQARIGAHAIVNTGAIVEHDCEIGRGASLSPGCRMGGRVRIGEGAFVSTGVTIAPRVTVGASAIVGAGAVVVDDVPAGMMAYGVPARVVRAVDPDRDWPRLL